MPPKQNTPKPEDGSAGKLSDTVVDWDQPPDDLPPYKEAAMDAWGKAKAAGAGKFTPGGLEDPNATQEKMEAKQQKATAVPPPVRSVLTFSANSSMWLSKTLQASPGIQGGLFYQNKSFCFSAGYRDGHRGMDVDDKGNFLRMRDPLGLQKLSTVFLGHFCWKLHKDNKLDFFAPISTFCPELEHRTFDALFPRDILNFTVGMSDAKVLQYLQTPAPKFDHKYHATVTEPLNFLFSPDQSVDPQPSRPKGSENLPPPKFGSCGEAPATSLYGSSASLAGGEQENKITSETVGMLMRQKLVKKIGEGASQIGPLVKNVRKPSPSHFALALLTAAIEKQFGAPYEELFRKQVTEPLGIMSIGFGIPCIMYRSSIFWQPSGLPCAHLSMKEKLDPGDARHAASPLFNSSLNMFGNPEDIAKLLLDVVDSAKEAVEELPRNRQAVTTMCTELGWDYNPLKKRFGATQSRWYSNSRRSPLEFTPYTASAMYDGEKDVGSFAVTNCGNRRSMLASTVASYTVSHHFIKQCIDTNMELTATDASGNPVEESTESKKWKADQTKMMKRPTKTPAQVLTGSGGGGGGGSSSSQRRSPLSSSSSKQQEATNDAAKVMNLSQQEQIDHMKKMSEEAEQEQKQMQKSMLNRASRFFKTGRLESDSFKNF